MTKETKKKATNGKPTHNRMGKDGKVPQVRKRNTVRIKKKMATGPASVIESRRNPLSCGLDITIVAMRFAERLKIRGYH